MHEFIYKEMVKKQIKDVLLIVCAAILIALLVAGAYEVFCALQVFSHH